MEERLLDILKHFNFSPSTFAEKLGVQRSSISHLLSGRNKPSFDFLTRMMTEIPELNMEWVINGKGSMLKKQAVPTVNKTLFDMENNLNDKGNSQKTSKTDFIQKDITTQEKESKFTNVNMFNVSSTKTVIKIVLFYNDHTWQEFLPS